jgi:hypothetical protein
MFQFPLQSLNFSLIIEVFENTGDIESSHDGATVDKDFPFCRPLPVASLAQLLRPSLIGRISTAQTVIDNHSTRITHPRTSFLSQKTIVDPP